MQDNLTITHLSSEYDKQNFYCGERSLDTYLQNYAGQDMRNHIAATFVLTEHEDTKILGYYSLASSSIQLSQIPDNIKKKFPKYPIVPAILIGRLAIDQDCQGKKYGELLLMDALHRSLQSSKNIGAAVVLVEAINKSAIKFYQHYDFTSFIEETSKLFMPMKNIKKIF